MSALAAVLSNIPCEQALLGFVWGWAENQIASASKAMPMGQTDGQKILQSLIPLMARVVHRQKKLLMMRLVRDLWVPPSRHLYMNNSTRDCLDRN